MNSKITIEVDFENGNEPVIQIISRNSDDIRDKLIRFFIERLGGDSSWCKIYCHSAYTSENDVDKFQRWKISPIQSKDFKKEAKAMLEQLRLLEQFEQAANSD